MKGKANKRKAREKSSGQNQMGGSEEKRNMKQTLMKMENVRSKEVDRDAKGGDKDR